MPFVFILGLILFLSRFSELWEQLLAARIRLQRVLSFVNQMPQDDDVWNSFTSVVDAESTYLTDCKSQIKSILDNLLHFQTRLLYKNPNTKFLIDANATTAGDDDEEILSSPDEDADDDKETKDGDKDEKEKNLTSKKLYKITEYPSILAQRHASFKQYRCRNFGLNFFYFRINEIFRFSDKTLLYWYEKTRLSSGKIGGKNDFGALEKNILKQIDQVKYFKNNNFFFVG